MICHTSDQIRLAEGIKYSEKSWNIFSMSLLKFLVLAGMPAPRDKVETFKSIKQGEGGTPPVEFNKDKNVLVELIKNFSESFGNLKTRNHPIFGKMTKQQWGRLIYLHLEHHLKQFGK